MSRLYAVSLAAFAVCAQGISGCKSGPGAYCHAITKGSYRIETSVFVSRSHILKLNVVCMSLKREESYRKMEADILELGADRHHSFRAGTFFPPSHHLDNYIVYLLFIRRFTCISWLIATCCVYVSCRRYAVCPCPTLVARFSTSRGYRKKYEHCNRWRVFIHLAWRASFGPQPFLARRIVLRRRRYSVVVYLPVPESSSHFTSTSLSMYLISTLPIPVPLVRGEQLNK